MTVHGELAPSGAGAAFAEGPNSQDWWQSRSSDELQAIADRGARAGDLFFAATAEMERRARNAEAELSFEEAKAAATVRSRQIAVVVAALVLILAEAVVVVGRL